MSTLCLSCGLCCNGALFSVAPLRPDEAVPPQVTVEVTPRGARRLRQPCTAHGPQGCGVYPSRPQACRGFRCLLLEAHQAGEVTLEEALGVVRDTVELMRLHRPGTPALEEALRFHFFRPPPGHRPSVDPEAPSG